MDEQQSFEELVREKGYLQLDQPHPGSPGHNTLMIAVFPGPTGKRFDPKALRVRVLDEDGYMCQRTLGPAAQVDDARHVRLGDVDIWDWNEDWHGFFTFGGLLEGVSDPDMVVYTLRSSAPILELRTPAESVPDKLASRVQALIGEIEVAWGDDDEGFALRLAQLDPLQLYVAAINSILSGQEGSRALHTTLADFHNALHREKAWLKATGAMPSDTLLLQDLLAREK